MAWRREVQDREPEGDDGADEPGELEAFLLNHKRFIDGRLSEHRDRDSVRLKYEWLADYHDRFCRSEVPPEVRGDLMLGTVEGDILVPFGTSVPIR